MAARIRAAKPCDLEAVLRISREAFKEPEDRFGRQGASWWLHTLAQPGTRLRVETPGPGLIRGYLLLVRYLSGDLVRLIAVDKTYGGQGIGKRLLATITASTSAWVRANNAPSRGLFESAGWTLASAPTKIRRRGSWVFYVNSGLDTK